MGNPYDLGNYAKEIRWSDMEQQLEKHFWPKPSEKSRDVMKEWFAQIAGKDSIIQGTELEVFFKELEEYSNKWANGKELSERDIAHFAAEKEGFLSRIFMDKNPKAIAGLIHSLIQINSEKLQKEEPVLANEKHFKNNKLAKEIIRNEDGTIQENLFDKNGNVARTIIKDKDGNIVNDKSFDWKGNVIEHTYPEDMSFEYKRVKEKQVTKDTEGNVIKEAYILENGSKREFQYDNDGKVFKEVIICNDRTWLRELNKDGGVVKETSYDEKGNEVCTTSYSYDKNYALRKKIANYPGDDKFSVETNYDSRGKEISEIFKNENGEVTQTKKYYYDKNGNETKTEKYGPDGELELTDIKTQNGFIIQHPNGESLEVSFDSSDNRIEVEKDKNGNVIKTTIEKRLENGFSETVEKTTDGIVITKRDDNYQQIEVINQTSDGKVNDITTYYYDNNGNETQIVVKDAKGNVCLTTEKAYDVKGRNTKVIKKNEKGEIISRTVSTYTDYKQATLECRMEFDASGKCVASEEFVHNNKRIVRRTVHNADGSKEVFDYQKETYIVFDSNGNIIEAMDF